MSDRANPGFDVEALRRGIEGETAAPLASLYAPDAEVRIVDRYDQPSRPKVLHGRDEIAEMLDDVYSRDMSHRLTRCVVQGDQVAFTEECVYPDGVRVFAESMLSVRDGEITEQTTVQAWDE
ncbi:nuclear transport factor 2 family protein [Streptomyces sp. NPDC018321]|uniref:nuclear transport factor 2 family protein n=1 Tax=unclassified Streptomyces TaxID=2593676 RepID=UPI0037B926FF